MQVVNELDTAAWRAFVEKNPAGNVFHTPEMFEVFDRTPGYTPALWACVDETGQILALLLPVQITLKGGIMRRLTTRAVAYGSILYDQSSAGHQAVVTLLESYTRHAGSSLLFTELRNLSDHQAVQPLLQQCGFVYEDHLDYLIDLTLPIDTLWRNMKRKARQDVRKAEKCDYLTVAEATTREELAVNYELIRKTYTNIHVPMPDFALFENLFDVLFPKGMIYCPIVYSDGQPAVADVDLVYKGVIYGWYTGMDRQFGSQNPSELLRWRLIEWGVNNGCRVLDFGGAGKPSDEYRVRDFKAKFGGELVCFGRNIYTHAPNLLRLSTLGYEAYRRYWPMQPRKAQPAEQTN